MKKQSTFIYFFAFTFFIFGCNQSSDTHSGDMMQQEMHQQSSAIQLNDGSKWKANEETIAGVKALQNSVDNLPSNPTREDYRLLKSNLEDNLNVIFEKCTMTGEAHEQLHNFLLPLTNMVEFLGSKDIEVCKTTTKEIKEHLVVFNTYFE